MFDIIANAATTQEVTEEIVEETTQNVGLDKVNELMTQVEEGGIGSLPFELIGIGVVILAFLVVCFKWRNIGSIITIAIIGALVIFVVTHPEQLWYFWQWIATTFKGF